MDRKLQRKFTGCLFLVGGLFYLLAEYITASNSVLPVVDVYTRYRIGSLAIPLQMAGNISTSYILIDIAFILLAAVLLAGAFLEVNKRINKFEIFYYPLLFITAVGMLLLGFYHLGNPGTVGMYESAIGMLMLGGNILLIVVGRSVNFSKLSKNITVLLGLTGLISALVILLSVLNSYQPVLERISIYTIIVWYIITGIELLKQ